MPRKSARAENWDEVHRSLLLKLAVVTAMFAWCTWYRELALRQHEDARLLLLVTVAEAVCLAAVLGRRPSLGSMCLVFLPYAVILAASTVLGYPDAALFFVLPTVMAAALLPFWAAMVMAVLGCVAVLAIPGLSADSRSAYVLLQLLAGLPAIITARDLRTHLWQAWGEREHVEALVREVRLRQEEVNRLNKALQVSNGLLKRSVRELAQAQKEAAEARHLKEQFATTVSHELRTPLNIILGFLELTQRYPEVYGDVNWTPALRRDLYEVQKSAQYLSELVNDILDLARVEALKMPIRREQTELGNLIEETVGLARRILMKDSPVRLCTDVPDGLPSLFIDRTRIRQVLLNLLANACRFTASGEIRVTAGLDDSQPDAPTVVVSVSDTGPGIPPEQLESIFDEFLQSSVSTLEEQHRAGKGLGLAIAKRFVQLHGGRIWAESQVGHGSTFHFSLPLAQKQTVLLGALPPELSIPGADNPTVVLVDEGEGQAFLSRHLEGYSIVQVPDVTQARKVVREQHPAAVVINVPPELEDVSSGGRLATQSLVIPEPVPVIQCSLPVGRWLLEPGLFSDWLIKPIDSDRLFRALERYAGVRRILIVEDDRALVHLLRRMLDVGPEGQARYQVDWAHSGEEALAKLKEQAVDAVLLDISLPGMDGRSVASAIRTQISPQLPIIALTARRPGSEGAARVPRAFSVTSYTGLSESDTLGLIKACLSQLKPAYVVDTSSAFEQAVRSES